MIVIISSFLDLSTQKVIEWLTFCKVDFVVLNNVNKLININVLINNDNCEIDFLIDKKQIKLDDVVGFWYRRDSLDVLNLETNFLYHPIFEKQFKGFANFELHKLKEYLNFKLKSKSLINNEEDTKINKLITLEYALKVGLIIPETYITINKKIQLLKSKLIVKPIGEAISFYYENYMCRLLTHEFKASSFTSDFPTLLQKMVDKLFEVRAFFLGKKFYSIAIFSQQNEKSLIDYRNYDFKNRNRSVPFNLPPEISAKCKKLMKKLNLNSGSIDFIYTKKNEFIFLEVNPIGQFDNVSKVGNYNLENKIAKILINGKY